MLVNRLLRTVVTLILCLLSLSFAQNGTQHALSSGDALAVNEAGEVLVAGRASYPNTWSRAGLNTVFYSKYSPDGEQQWLETLTFERDTPVSEVAFDSAGDLIVAGRTSRSLYAEHRGEMDVYLAKYREGKPMWRQQFGSPKGDAVSDLFIDQENNVYLLGSIGGALVEDVQGDRDTYVAKYSPQGEQLWVRQFSVSTRGSESLRALTVDAEGNVYFTGYYSLEEVELRPGTVPTGVDVLLVKLNASGEMLWERIFGSVVIERVHGLAVSGESVYVTGDTASSSGTLGEVLEYPTNSKARVSIDGILAHYSTLGEQQWVRHFGYNRGYSGSSVAVDIERSVVVGSGNGALGGPELGASDAFVMSVTPEGQFEWADSFGTEHFDEARAVITDEASNIYVTGYLNQIWEDDYGTGSRGQLSFVAKYSPQGERLWLETLNLSR